MRKYRFTVTTVEVEELECRNMVEAERHRTYLLDLANHDDRLDGTRTTVKLEVSLAPLVGMDGQEVWGTVTS